LNHPLRAYLTTGNRIVKDITDEHAFTGYNPVIFALHSLPEPAAPVITILFSHKSLQPNETFHRKDAIAILSMQKIQQQVIDNDTIVYYKGIHGMHRLVSPFHQSVTKLSNRLFNKKAGNVFLSGNLYSQVQIAYALPRTISLITVGQPDGFNLFPTDLHGPIGDHHYIISLRHEGKACSQVEAARNIVISEIDANAYKTAYALGKNHMQDAKSEDQFPFGKFRSANFNLPLPSAATFYRELTLQDLFRDGIHQIMLFSVVTAYSLATAPATLAHIHNACATWRDNNQLEGNYLLR
jgi:hypothetical protein